MSFTDLFIRRPVLSICVNLLIFVAGYQAIQKLNVRQYPRSDTAVITFPGSVAGTLSDGKYRVTLAPAGVVGRLGTVLDGNGDGTAGDPFTTTFVHLSGDANHDGKVNLADFAALRANFGRSAAIWAQGDFTYDGKVNLADFALLRALPELAFQVL